MYSGGAVLFFFLMGVFFGILAYRFYQDCDDNNGGTYA